MKESLTKPTSIDKALMILSSFRPNNKEMGTVEISQKLGFHKATVSRILLNLARHGYLKQDPRTKLFKLGPSIVRLSVAIEKSLKSNLVHIAKPIIDDLRDRLEDSIVLEVLSGENTIIAYIAEGPWPIHLAGNIGDVLPIHTAAGAKAILAFSSPDIWDNFIHMDMQQFTPYTITDPAELKRQYKKIKSQGFSVDREEHDIGVSAFGVPVFDYRGNPVAAVVAAGPSHRIKMENAFSIVPVLKETARTISSQLYYSNNNGLTEGQQ